MGQVRTYTGGKFEPIFFQESVRISTVKIAASQTIAKGTLLGQITTGGAFAPYADGNSNGTQTARAIALYDMITDSSGNITFGSSGTPGDFDAKASEAPVIFGGGAYRAAELVGLDANGLADLGGRYILGASGGADAVVMIP